MLRAYPETPSESGICDPQKSAVFSAAKIHADTSRFWHGTMGILDPAEHRSG
jgi:hypothetical protein